MKQRIPLKAILYLSEPRLSCTKEAFSFSLFFFFFFLTHTLCITILTVSVTTVITVKEAIVLLRHYEVNRIRHDHTVGAPKHSTDDHWSVTGAFYSELHIILTAGR